MPIVDGWYITPCAEVTNYLKNIGAFGWTCTEMWEFCYECEDDQTEDDDGQSR